MKHTYCKVECKHPRIEKPMKYGWMLKVSSFEALMDYIMTDTSMGNAFQDACKSKDFTPKGGHCRTDLGETLVRLCKLTEKSLAGTMDQLAQDATEAKIKMLQKHGYLYINEVGGFFPKEKGVKELKKITYEGSPHKGFLVAKDNEDILSSKARYTQWTNGSHWYAKIGNIDVVINGNQKWGTKWEAEEAVKKFKKNLLKEKND